MSFLDDLCRAFCSCFSVQDDEEDRRQLEEEHRQPSSVDFSSRPNRAQPSRRPTNDIFWIESIPPRNAQEDLTLGDDGENLRIAREHLEAKHQCLNQAKKERATQLKRVCYTQARAHGEAALNAMQRHFDNNADDNKLDLHHYSVEEASRLLIFFLESKIRLISGTGKELRVYIITGKGLHSADGVPKIKNEVVKILQRNRLEFSEMKKNHGCLLVKLKDKYNRN